MLLARSGRVPHHRPSLSIAPCIDHASAPLAGIGILVVEGDPEARRVACAALEAWGGAVVGVASAREALQTFEAIIPSLVLTDLGLPDLDGTWLLRRIRLLPPDRGGRVPIVAFSAYAQPRERELIRAAGFQDLIAKPVDPFELCAVIARHLPGR
jgi:CheY-like chemotaxis protein